jgi:hypothetical protein
MKTWTLVALLLLVPPVFLRADETLVARFDGGIGVDPVSGLSSGAPVPNVVRGVAPGGIVWHIGEFHARVDHTGHIFIMGRRLVLAGGDNMGQSLGLSVQGQLFCGASSKTPLTTTTTTLSADGNFQFDERLSAAPPDPCVDAVLLIVIPGSSPRWLAAGVPNSDLTVHNTRHSRWQPR